MVTRCCAALLLLTLMTGCGDESVPGAGEGAAASRESVAPSDEATPSASVEPTPSMPDEPSPTSGPARRGTRIVVSGSEFGRMLFDSTGQAIYLFDREPTSRPRCYGTCAEAWPPVLTQGEPVPGPGVDGSLLGTTERTDGTVQVTYNEHPLYLYAHEDRGEVKCHDVFLDGGNWYVVQPGGRAAPPG